MIDDDSPAGSWRDAMLFRKHMYIGRDDEEDHPTAEDYRNRAERAEAECRELRAKLDAIQNILRPDASHIIPKPVRKANLRNFDESGWNKFSSSHFWRMVCGERLDYWPSTKRYRYGGKTSQGDVLAFITKVLDERKSK
jgi:hypothetical protein